MNATTTRDRQWEARAAKVNAERDTRFVEQFHIAGMKHIAELAVGDWVTVTGRRTNEDDHQVTGQVVSTPKATAYDGDKWYVQIKCSRNSRFPLCLEQNTHPGSLCKVHGRRGTGRVTHLLDAEITNIHRSN